MLVDLHEQFYCPNESCGAVLPPAHVDSRIDIPTGIRTIRCLCPHCDQMFIGKFRLRGGIWETIGKIEREGREKTIRGFKARIEHVTGAVEAMSA